MTCSACKPLLAQQTIAEQYLFQAVNESRSAAGLPLLVWSDGLRKAAAQHAEAMQKQDCVAHQYESEPDLPERVARQGVRFSVVAENLGVSVNAVDLHTIWMDSPDHRSNMLDPAVNSVGIAVRESGGELWAVEDFSATLENLSLDQQEARVKQLLLTVGVPSSATDAARGMCRQSSGFVGRRPDFVMRFNATGLTRLPAELMERLQRGRASQAAVGACTYSQAGFSSYSIAVALYH